MQHSRVVKLSCTALCLLAVLTTAVPVLARAPIQKYPRLANYYLNPDITVAQAAALSKWDLVILGIEAQYENPEVFRVLRAKNPDIIILAYIASEEVSLRQLAMTDPAHPLTELARRIADTWWLRDATGGFLNYWPGTRMLNVTNRAPLVDGKRWNTALPEFLHTQVMQTGLWDGLFYDNMFGDIAWLNGGNVDADGDSVADLAVQLNADWQDGMRTMLARSRELEGSSALILGNGGGEYFTSVNGRMLEAFPADDDGGWSGAMQRYADALKRGKKPAAVIVNTVSSTGRQDDYRAMRFHLMSTLLENGYFSFDYGITRHADLWWYDEYAAYLGIPRGNARRVDGTASAYRDGIWLREFSQAQVVVNATDRTQTVELHDGYERLQGVQASRTNSGAVVQSVSVPARDGTILLKRQVAPDRGSYTQGAFARFFTPSGTATRQGFFVNIPKAPNGSAVLRADLDADRKEETVLTNRGRVTVLSAKGKVTGSFTPFGAGYRGMLSVAAGDLDGDGRAEIVVGAGRGGGPQVRVFSVTGRLLQPEWLAFARSFRGGTSVAVADVNGDGRDEVLVGAGRGGGPQVRVFSHRGLLLRTFFAFDPAFRGGVSVAAGDLDGDGRAEIVVGAGRGGGPQVRVFDRNGRARRPGFFAFDPAFRGGTLVSVADVNHDHMNEIIVTAPTIY